MKEKVKVRLFDIYDLDWGNKPTVTISNISWRDIYPLPSKSYIEKAHFNFCSNLPLDVTLNAHKNSRKSIVPSPLASNVRKTCSAN